MSRGDRNERGRGRKVKPQRGGSREFNSDLSEFYIDNNEDEGNNDNKSFDKDISSESIINKVANISLACNETRGKKDSNLQSCSSSSSDQEEDSSHDKNEKELTNSTKSHYTSSSSKTDSNIANPQIKKPSDNHSQPPKELSRREREAIEKERAKQYYLQMKEKEDAARLAVIRKQREAAAQKHAIELKTKEDLGRKDTTFLKKKE